VALGSSEKTRPMMMALFLQLRDWVNAAGLLLMLSAAACATAPAPQIAAPPPGQARIWFYRLIALLTGSYGMSRVLRPI
jgi:hypothetical protein